MKNITRIKELVSQLNAARNSYYNESDSKISDYEYDNLFDELKSLEESTGFVLSNSPCKSVGFEVKSKLVKHKHTHPMLSLDKTKLVSDLVEFAKGKDCLLMHKLDGLTVLLTYENGELVQAETRGNGEEGEIITHNARVFKNIPLHINFKEKLEIEGEAIITYDDFENINSKLADEDKYKNPRNLVSGSVRQLDSKIAASRNIKFIAWKVPSGISDNSFLCRLKTIEKLGFDIVPLWTYTNLSNDKENIDKMIEDLKSRANKLGYPIDGLVMSYSDIPYGESLGMTGHHPKHSIAFKFYDEESVTNIREIEWSMGKSGSLTPVAIFETVDIEGTEVSRASLHNVSILKDLQIGIGDEVTVYKANAIIPQVRENLTRSGNISIPTKCPICNGKTAIVKENETEVLTCTNNSCKGKLLGKLTHFVSKNALNIDGFSEATLEKFIELGWLNSFIDIYNLRIHTGEMIKLEGFGAKSVYKLLDSIEKSKTTTLDRFIYSLSIPLIGRTASKTISKYFNGNYDKFLKEYLSCEYYNYTVLDDFGGAMSDSLNEWLDTNYHLMQNLELVMNIEKPKEVVATDNKKNLIGLTFVITGSLNTFTNRDACKEEIELLGGKVSGSVSAKTSYLVNNDIASNSGKNKTAKELGIPIISEEQLLQMIR